MKPETTVMQSFVFWNKGPSLTAFFVSTVERDSSAALAFEHRYYETIVWGWDQETRETKSMISQHGGPKNLKVHFEICEQLHKTGKYFDSEDGEQ